MYKKTRLQLTILYTIIFLILFWGLSFGIYFWMNRYFGDNSKRMHYLTTNANGKYIYDEEDKRTEPESDVIMDKLGTILFSIDLLVLLGIPTITWFLTGKTLLPIQQSHARERQFYTNASHDLRTPLSILKGEIDLALRKKQTQSSFKNILQSNKEEVDQLISLVETMFFFSRNNEQQQISKKEDVDLIDILFNTIATHQKQSEYKNIQLSFRSTKESISIMGNAQLLQRLFSNIIENAIKYTADKGTISVRLFRENQNVTCKIKDSGVGISHQQQEKIFNRFYRGETSMKEEGYGLGLSIARQIVEYHEGTISLLSVVGKGTTVTITFPLFTQNPERNRS